MAVTREGGIDLKKWCAGCTPIPHARAYYRYNTHITRDIASPVHEPLRRPSHEFPV